MARTFATSGMAERRGWTTRDIVVTGALAVAVGLIWAYVWTPIWVALSAALGPLVGMFLGGFWIIGGVLVPYIIRKPGAAILGEVIAAFVEAPTSFWGVSAILSAVFEGAPCELVFLATGYRRFSSIWLMIAAGAGGAVFFVYYYWLSGIGKVAPELLLVSLALRVLGAAVLAGLGSRGVGAALLPTGVLDSFAIGRERRQEI